MDSINKKLYENYEEAGFAILMDEYAQQEGDRLLAEYNNSLNNPAFSPPEGMEDRGIKRIRREFRKRALHTAFRHIYKPLARIAIVVLALNVFFSIAFFSIEAFRVEVLNMALEFQETHTSVRFIDSDADFDRLVHYSEEDIQKAIPDSFQLISSEEFESGSNYIFSDDNGHTIEWRELPTSTEFNLDTEDAASVDRLIINDTECIVVEKDGCTSAVWYEINSQCTCCIIADLGKSDTLDILKNILN